MKLRNTFIFFNIFCILLTISLVSYNFFKDLKGADEIYNDVYSCSLDITNENFKSSLLECCSLTEERLGGRLDSKQTEYLYELHTTVERLDEIQIFLSSGLLNSKKKTTNLAKVYERINSLNIKKSDLIEEFALYKIKLSGNVSGDPEGVFKLFVEDVLTYLSNYTDEISILNKSIFTELKSISNAEYNVVEIYLNSVKFLCKNFSDAHFTKNSFETLRDINTRVLIIDANIETNPNCAGGMYSSVAQKFVKSYKDVDEEKFIENYYTNLGVNDISNETHNEKIAFYYFKILLREVTP